MKERKKLRKPPNLQYGVNDRPSNWALAVLGLEHGALLIASLMAGVFFAQTVGLSSSQTISLINAGFSLRVGLRAYCKLAGNGAWARGISACIPAASSTFRLQWRLHKPVAYPWWWV